jgi:hypothetical protein
VSESVRSKTTDVKEPAETRTDVKEPVKPAGVPPPAPPVTLGEARKLATGRHNAVMFALQNWPGLPR